MGKFKGEFRDRPWLGEDAIRILEENLTKESQVLETGAGASTLWLADRAGLVISYEHNLAWYEAVNAELRQRGKKNALVIYDIDYPKNGISRLGSTKRPFDMILLFDLILIDGRGRVKSIKTTHKMLRPGGILMLDNANRPRYQPGRDFLTGLGWPAQNILSRIQPENKKGYTTFWRKPE